jgi:RimJ/RimL family protein N-acetyltransferase
MGALSEWTTRPRPGRAPMQGRYVRLEPCAPAHEEGLFAASMDAQAQRRHRYLLDPVMTRADYAMKFAARVASDDPLNFTVIDAATGRIGGRQAFMRIEPAHGVIEIGNILWGDGVSGTRLATEALFLFARHVFDDLGYRRFEWKCDSENASSRAAALRFGFSFEGLFRQHMVIKGENRDTAWFAMLDRDWPRLRQAYEGWLAPDNFDAQGFQQRKLADFKAETGFPARA